MPDEPADAPAGSPADEQGSKPGPGSDDFDPSAHMWDGNTWWTQDKGHWWDGSVWRKTDAALEAVVAARTRRPGIFSTGDFWIGVAATILGNLVLGGVYGTVILSVTYPQPDWVGVLNMVPWVLNIGGLIVAALTRPRIAIGMLAAYGCALTLVLLAGIVLFTVCFGGSRGGSGVGT